MASTKHKDFLLRRKKELEDLLRSMQPLQEELAEINNLLNSYGRGGWERPGHENGCRCHECDPSR